MTRPKPAARDAKRVYTQLPLPLRMAQRALGSRVLWRAGGGLALIVTGVITLVTLLGWNAGGLVSAWSGVLRQAFGVGALLFSLIMIGIGAPLLLNARIDFGARRLVQIIGGEVAFLALLALIHSLAFGVEGFALAQAGGGGGAVGWVLSRLVFGLFGAEEGIARLLAIGLWFALLAISAVIAFQPILTREAETEDTARRRPIATAGDALRQPTMPAPPISLVEPTARKKGAPAPAVPPASKTAPTADQPAPPTGPNLKIKSNATIIRAEEKKPAPPKTDKKPRKPTVHGTALPPISLLKQSKDTKSNDADVQRQADIIETTLAQFGLAGRVVEIRRGPTVTQYGIEPGYLERPGPNGEKRMQKIRVSQIANLHSDFALALEAPSIRIEAPIPGRGLVGIEVPNVGVGVVDLRGVMESEAFQKVARSSPLAVALGRDVAGASIAADLARMPHLLIAGTTGSGKSVCISAITACLAITNRPEDLKFVMIDPKMVELSRFLGLPHIVGKPESDLERIPAVLRWVTREMDGRYKKFAEAGARNLADYNAMLSRRGEETLPRIVVLIDELADLMLQSPIETEKTLCRLAQMARATGIHLVVATQRPSVDVVTGLIKANFPARIAFSVASSTDSRVILDQVGAESLLGRGDMLFLNPESGHPLRMQGCWVSDKEIGELIKWWTKQIETEKAKAAAEAEDEPEAEEEYVANRKPELETPWELEVAEMAQERAMASMGKGGRAGGGGGSGDDAAEDDLVKRAIEIIQSTGNASTSLLQRKLRIGYPRAARLMEELQEMGYVGGASRQAGKGREVRARDEEL
jgi:S-DNA-T family DNA segregation ATPase FtsK/SpoIIIE